MNRKEIIEVISSFEDMICLMKEHLEEHDEMCERFFPGIIANYIAAKSFTFPAFFAQMMKEIDRLKKND